MHLSFSQFLQAFIQSLWMFSTRACLLGHRCQPLAKAQTYSFQICNLHKKWACGMHSNPTQLKHPVNDCHTNPDPTWRTVRCLRPVSDLAMQSSETHQGCCFSPSFVLNGFHSSRNKVIIRFLLKYHWLHPCRLHRQRLQP